MLSRKGDRDMKTIIMRGTLFTILSFFFIISSSDGATERRIALVIGNGNYSIGRLKNPVNDAADVAVALKRAGFAVTLKKDANLQDMVETIEDFGNSLKRGGVGLFYYAGHGVQVNGVNYLLPINARINKETDVRFQAVDAGRVLAEMENANNGLNIVIFDACRDNPFGKSFRSASRGLAIVANAPSGTLISYSTGAGQVAQDGEGRNSPYTRALLENIAKPGLTISKVFMNVRSKVKKETGQVPWELSSLEGDFFFMPGNEKSATTSGDSSVSASAATDDLDDENRKLEAEERKQAKKTTTLAMGKRPAQSTAAETARDGRFIAYSNGTVLDTSTNLMWAAKDNGVDINWQSAKAYCENYRGGGYTDWRMPTQDELAGLYDASKSRQGACNRSYSINVVTELVNITCFAYWASETRRSDAAYFTFDGGSRYWYPNSFVKYVRALPVRLGK